MNAMRKDNSYIRQTNNNLSFFSFNNSIDVLKHSNGFDNKVASSPSGPATASDVIGLFFKDKNYKIKLLIAKIKSSIFRAKKPGESKELTSAGILDRESKPYEGLNP
jgi:hypothetical protein